MWRTQRRLWRLGFGSRLLSAGLVPVGCIQESLTYYSSREGRICEEKSEGQDLGSDRSRRDPAGVFLGSGKQLHTVAQGPVQRIRQSNPENGG